MASDWIKMRIDLDNEPEVVAVAQQLNVNEMYVVGCLHKLWSIADQHSTDGFLRGYTPIRMDAKVHLSGFSEALASQGWLVISNEGIEIPKFTDHNGASGKARARSLKSMRRKRNDNKTSTKEQPNDNETLIRAEKQKQITEPDLNLQICSELPGGRIEFSEPDAAPIAGAIFQKTQSSDPDSGLFWQVACLVAHGVIREADAYEAAQSVADCDNENPVGYFRSILGRRVGNPEWLKQQVARVRLPRGFNRGPPVAGSGEFMASTGHFQNLET